MDWSGSTGTPAYNAVTGSMGNTNASTAQLRWLDVFLNNAAITGPMALGQIQIGFQGWDNTGIKWLQGGTFSMTNTVTGIEAVTWYTSFWGGGGSKGVGGKGNGPGRAAGAHGSGGGGGGSGDSATGAAGGAGKGGVIFILQFF